MPWLARNEECGAANEARVNHRKEVVDQWKKTVQRPVRLMRFRLFAFLAVLGPGFITANVDHDPGGILTYSQAGPKFAYPLLWTTNLMAPEAYTLKSALDGWILGESNNKIRERAAVAYDKYQKCGLNAARKLMATGW